MEHPQSCRDHGLVSSLCSAVSSSLARHLPMARRIHAWHDLAVSWRLLQHLPCIVVVLLLVQLCAPQRRLGMRGRRDSGSVAGERRGTSAPSRHNVVVCAAVCLPPITSLRGSVLAAHHQPDTLPKSGCAGALRARCCSLPASQDQTQDVGHWACGNTRQAGCAGRSHPISAVKRRMSSNIKPDTVRGRNSGQLVEPYHKVQKPGGPAAGWAACQSRRGRRGPFPTTTYARRARKRVTGCMTARRFSADAWAWLSDRDELRTDACCACSACAS